jgi:hypothetical protein
MNQKKLFAVLASGATLMLALGGTAVAHSSAGTTVTVRVEGLSKELLPPTSVKVPTSGWITKGGTPTGKCPAASAAGALNVATKGHWGATYSSSLGQAEIVSILGESHPFTSNDYWDFVVNNKARPSRSRSSTTTPRARPRRSPARPSMARRRTAAGA